MNCEIRVSVWFKVCDCEKGEYLFNLSRVIEARRERKKDGERGEIYRREVEGGRGWIG